jgi:hypothetical protein
VVAGLAAPLRQIPTRSLGLTHPQRRQPTALGPPPIAGLAADTDPPAGLDRADTLEDQLPVLVPSTASCRLRPRHPNSTPSQIAGALRQALEPARRRGVKSGPSLTASPSSSTLPAVRSRRGAACQGPRAGDRPPPGTRLRWLAAVCSTGWAAQSQAVSERLLGVTSVLRAAHHHRGTSGALGLRGRGRRRAGGSSLLPRKRPGAGPVGG